MSELEAVIKVGGSLAESEALPALCHQISLLARAHRLLVVPGGGPFADSVRHYYDRWRLSESTAHKMAILAMDQYGYLLCDLMPGSVPVSSFAQVEPVHRGDKIAVLIPSPLLFCLDPLPHSWKVTADSIAAWVAVQMQARTLVLMKAVDGVHSTFAGEQLLAEATLDQFESGEVVDGYLPVILSEVGLNTWIVNGSHPERLAELLARGETRGTHLRRA